LLGSRLVLPPDFDVTRTGTAKPVAEALRDYGAYVVDVDAGAFFQICINGVLPDGWVSQLQPLVEELRVVVPK
jgi:hypothetical protein